MVKYLYDIINIKRETLDLLPPKNRSAIVGISPSIGNNLKQSNLSVNSQVQNNTDSSNIGYKANLIIRNDANGKKYLYDMIKIEREHSRAFPPKNRSRLGSRSLSNESIVQETSNKVNTQNEIKNSLKTEEKTDIKTLQKENSYLKRKVESLKEEFKLAKGYEPKPEDVDRMATRILLLLQYKTSTE